MRIYWAFCLIAQPFAQYLSASIITRITRMAYSPRLWLMAILYYYTANYVPTSSRDLQQPAILFSFGQHFGCTCTPDVHRVKRLNIRVNEWTLCSMSHITQFKLDALSRTTTMSNAPYYSVQIRRTLQNNNNIQCMRAFTQFNLDALSRTSTISNASEHSFSSN